MANKTLSVEQVIARGIAEGFLPYSIARLINDQLEKAGFEQIRPQMMYNYDRNGLINGTKAQNSVRPYTLDETNKFVTKFVAMRIAKGRKVQTIAPSSFQVEQIEAISAEILETEPQLEINI
jgi:hypothetical protein